MREKRLCHRALLPLPPPPRAPPQALARSRQPGPPRGVGKEPPQSHAVLCEERGWGRSSSAPKRFSRMPRGDAERLQVPRAAQGHTNKLQAPFTKIVGRKDAGKMPFSFSRFPNNRKTSTTWDAFRTPAAPHLGSSAPRRGLGKHPSHRVQPLVIHGVGGGVGGIKGQCGDEPDCTVRFNRPLIKSCDRRIIWKQMKIDTFSACRGKGKAGRGCCGGMKGGTDVHGGSVPSRWPWGRARQLLPARRCLAC